MLTVVGEDVYPVELAVNDPVGKAIYSDSGIYSVHAKEHIRIGRQHQGKRVEAELIRNRDPGMRFGENHIVLEVMAMSVSFELEADGTVAFLTLAVPPINALDENALQDLMKALDEVENNETIRALVIASDIKGIFCSGGNLKYWPRVYPERSRIR